MDYQTAGEKIAMQGAISALTPRQLTIRERVEQRMEKIKEEQAECKELLELLDKNPDFERMMSLLPGKF